jgi:hypothetical protein
MINRTQKTSNSLTKINKQNNYSNIDSQWDASSVATIDSISGQKIPDSNVEQKHFFSLQL